MRRRPTDPRFGVPRWSPGPRPTWDHPPTVVCDTCGKEFSTKRRSRFEPPARWCSRACTDVARSLPGFKVHEAVTPKAVRTRSGNQRGSPDYWRAPQWARRWAR